MQFMDIFNRFVFSMWLLSRNGSSCKYCLFIGADYFKSEGGSRRGGYTPKKKDEKNRVCMGTEVEGGEFLECAVKKVYIYRS